VFNLYKRTKKIYRGIRSRGVTLYKGVKQNVYTFIHNGKKISNGVNIIGFPKGDFGIGEHLRLVTNAIKTTGINFCLNNIGNAGLHPQNNEQVSHLIIKDNPYLVNLFCFNSDQTLLYMKSTRGKIAVNKHYNIGYGYWELTKYPAEWTKQNKYLNEIWAPSRFIKKVVEKSTTLPVYYMPIPVDFENPAGYTRKHFQLPENSYLFLFTFDMSSFVTRKNPEAVIEAFTRAFPVEKNDRTALVIKISRLKHDMNQSKKVEKLRQQVAFDSRIIVLDEVYDRGSILGLLSVCDSYISLHRSEGFGLGMAEAMKMGKVVIATNYSGNEDFMNEDNSCSVRYKLIKVKLEDYCYIEEGAVWAEPDIEHAIYYMRKVYDDQCLSQKIGGAAMAYIKEHHNFRVIGENYRNRLKEILRS
jgi:glycosyltransferase involved in cell wall biosynthesis